MKRRGRFVLEAALLTPGICILLVYLVYFTLYAHDCAALAHGALESGVKGLYEERLPDRQIEQNIKNDLYQKLKQRVLWVTEPEVEVQVNPVCVAVRLSGQGAFLNAGEISVQQKLYRLQPCAIIRRSRWLQESGRKRT